MRIVKSEFVALILKRSNSTAFVVAVLFTATTEATGELAERLSSAFTPFAENLPNATPVTEVPPD